MGNWSPGSHQYSSANGPANRECQRRPAGRSVSQYSGRRCRFQERGRKTAYHWREFERDDPGAITPFGSGQVVVNGAIDGVPTFAYARVRTQPAWYSGSCSSCLGRLAPVSLEVVQGSVLVENGATLTTTGSGVGRIPGATGESLVTITGFFNGEGPISSTWIENGALSVGLASQGRVVIADQASFEGAETVTIGTSGEIDIGVGGLAGIFAISCPCNCRTTA